MFVSVGLCVCVCVRESMRLCVYIRVDICIKYIHKNRFVGLLIDRQPFFQGLRSRPRRAAQPKRQPKSIIRKPITAGTIGEQRRRGKGGGEGEFWHSQGIQIRSGPRESGSLGRSASVSRRQGWGRGREGGGREGRGGGCGRKGRGEGEGGRGERGLGILT